MIELIEKNGEEKNIINAIYIFLTKIFNRNLNDKKFTQTEIEDLIDIDVAMYLIREYQKFLSEVIQGINFLTIPYYPTNDSEEQNYKIETVELKNN